MAFDITRLETELTGYLRSSAGNTATVGGREITLFDDPLFAYASAEDPLFQRYKDPSVIGPHFRLPEEWLPGAKTVISVFFPFSDAVRKSNTGERGLPGEAWLFGRVEGQAFINGFSERFVSLLVQEGFTAVSPSVSEDFWSVSAPSEPEELSFTSNWSERHVAFAAGMGTFGLSKGIITRRGMAGRFTSVITTWETSPTEREYTDVYEWCIRCGACVRRCPGHAISLEHGKDHSVCLEYQKSIIGQLRPRFGCGMCQTEVPCESRRP